MNPITKTLLFLSPIFFTAAEENKPKAFFQATPRQPYHLSVGAVLFNRDGNIACHHFDTIFGYKNIYILMRESIEDNETPIACLSRGLKEEFGATARPIAFLGSISGYLPDSNLPFDKTTLYVVCELIEWNPEERDPLDPEASSTIQWMKPDQLIELMRQQKARFPERTDADESEMIERAIPYIQQQ